MQVLTPTGYVDINDLNVGDEVVAYDVNDGHLFTNILEAKVKWTYDMLPPVAPVYELDAEGNIIYDQDGNPIILVPGKTSEEVFQETYGDWKFYLINNTWVLYCNQSVWANMDVVHASELQIGDIIYDDQDQDVTITSIEEVTAPDWWRLQISGDHSYIADNLTLHNASRYWVGGGSSSNWNATGNTNWGSASGGANNASVPTAVDDVTFDGAGPNGNTASIISATIIILSLNITTGYTSTMTHNQVLTIQGNWTFINTYTIAGTAGITIGGTSTITSNGTTWPNALTLSTSTKTLVGDLTVNGLLTVGSNPVLNRTTTEKITVKGGLFSSSSTLSGTAGIYLTGGTWSSANVSFAISSNLFLNGNITVSGGVACSGGSITYQSGTITTTGSTLNIGAGNYYIGAVTWNNITLIGNNTITLVENLTALGTLSILNNILNSNTLTCNGLTISTSLYGLSGTTKIILTGGTWSGNNTFANPCDIQGNVTISGTVQRNGSTLTYISGTVTTTGSTLNLYGGTLNTNSINWNNVVLAGGTTTITSNLNIYGTISYSASGFTYINKTTTEVVNIYGTLNASYFVRGTADYYLLNGSTWTNNAGAVDTNLYINGNCTISGIVGIGYSTANISLVYLSGTVTTTGSTLVLRGSSNVNLNTNGVIWNNVSITSSSSGLYTLLSNFSMTGTLTVANAAAINTSVAATWTISNGLTVNAALSGTAKLILTGGTWSGSSQLSNNLDLNGNVTINGSVTYSSNTITYVSGFISTGGSTVTLNNSVTLNTNGMSFYNVICNSVSGSITLTSDLTVSNLLSLTYVNGVILKTTNQRVFTSSLIQDWPSTHTADFYITGGGQISGGQYFTGNMYIIGDTKFGNSFWLRSGTLNYVKGNVSGLNCTLTIDFSTVLTGRFDKIPLKAVVFAAGNTTTCTMDTFFTGTPSRNCVISCTTVPSYNMNIVFTDGFEKVARNVSISGVTVSRPNQLLVVNNSRFNTSRGTNGLGIRYTNQSPNGVSKGTPSINDTMTVPALGLVRDPCFQYS